MTEDATSPPSSAADKADGETAPTGSPPVAPPAPAAPPYRPNYIFLAVVSIVSLAADLGTKYWAKSRLEDAKSFYPSRRVEVIQDHVSLVFAQNKGGAWGLLQNQPEAIRRPFFLIISVLAIGFIVSLYRRLTPQQLALKWGLPLVLGGALGNLINRIQYNYVVDFIDVRASWIRSIQGLFSSNATDHWPTFNVADIAICVGVGLMAIDMFTSRRPPKKATGADAKPEARLPDEASKPTENAS